jgi:uncharacterized membrane protein YgaE (UPF0421/DUF939 family)
MRFEKKRVAKSIEALTERADDCFDLAKTQHKAADQQHELANKQHDLAHQQHENAETLDASADKLDTVGQALEAQAISLKGELEIDAGRTSPRLRSLLEGNRVRADLQSDSTIDSGKIDSEAVN